MTARGLPVAIVGIGCRFPGGVTDPASFWRLLAGGVDAIAEIPADRIDLAHYFDPRPAVPGRMMTRWGGFLDRIEDFDAEFFGISPREAERLDPQQRLILETGWEAFEDAGWNVAALAGTRGGVFVGQWISDFESRLFAEPEAVDFYMTTGSGRYAASGRLSYLLDLQGPSLTIDSACSSSLAAVHLAVASIRSGESEFALAGGVNVILQPHISIAYSQSRMMAPDGRCKFGDARGDGYVRSEGAGLVLLKPLDRAIADGDRVYAVIRGSAVNNDGRGSGSMGTPSRPGQEALLRSAYHDAGCSPGSVDYVEAHGTGTRAGDPIELGALGAVLLEGRASGHHAWAGSVKTNFGHTEGAAGVAGLIKAALALHHSVIPPSLHCIEPNPGIPWADLPVRIARDAVAWPSGARARRAGVSAFGIAGTNAHVVLDEAPSRSVAPSRSSAPRPGLLVLSAKGPGALRALAGRYKELVEREDGPGLGELCWSAATRRTGLEHRAAFEATERASLVEALRGYATGGAAAAEGVARVGERPKVVFVFPGQGAQWVGMGRDLLAAEPVFREALERCDAAARPYLNGSIIDQLMADPTSPNFAMDRIEFIQPVLVAMAIGYAALWRSYGVTPDAVIGHSMGEVGAAYLAGVLDLDEAMRIICRRSALMARARGQGAMAMLDLSMADAERRVAAVADRVSVAVSNSPRSSVISGDPVAVAAIVAELEAGGVFCRLVKVDVASHSPQMEGPARDLVAELADLKPKPAVLPIYSTVLGRQADGAEFGAAYWGDNLRRPVRFLDSVLGARHSALGTCFLELGPHPVLTVAVEQTMQARGGLATAVACGRRDTVDSGLAAVGALWTAGVEINWSRVLGEGSGFVALPRYPWQRERHWVREAVRADDGGRGTPSRPVTLPAAQLDWLHELRWVPAPSLGGRRTPTGTVLLVGSASSDEPAFRAAFEAEGWSVAFVRSTGDAERFVREAGRNPVAVVLIAAGADDMPFGVLALGQALLGVEPGAGQHRLMVATTGAQAIASAPRPRVAVGQGVLWGIGRVFAEEHPELWAGLIDLDPGADGGSSAVQLAAEVCRGDGEGQVAVRDGLRFMLRLQALAADPASSPAVSWPAAGAWLITGGLGDVALHLARAMVGQGVRRLVLMGRSGLPSRETWRDVPPESRDGRRIAAVQALEAAGASVHILVADLADAGAVARALGEYEAAAWPPIRGVLHAAGVLETRLASQTDRESLRRVVAPKLDGAMTLDRLLPGAERFVVISSLSAALGIPGMASYAGANTGLDALIMDRRARGLHGLSIQSGAWIDTGMHSGASADQNLQQLHDLGIQGTAPADAVAVFTALAGRPEAVVTVMPVDWSAFQAARRGRSLRLFTGRGPIGSESSPNGGGVAEQLAAAAPGDRRLLVDPLVREAVGRVLKMAPSRIDSRKPLGAMGLSSLMAMELRNRLEAALGRPLSATLAWNYPTVEALVGFLSDGAAATPAPAASAPAAARESAGLSAVAQLSDEDATRLLRRRR